jgi:N-acetylmuramoyl-L-alanine amidase
LSIVKLPSPNFDERLVENNKAAIEMLVLHYTDTLSAKEAIDILISPERKVSAHYVVAEDGTLYSLVEESKRAWHAGVSYWRGRENINACSIGIEIVNPGHIHGYREFTTAQYDVLIPLCQRIKKQYSIKDADIVAHSDIAPERKKDPGELFNWKLLADNGLGLWPNELASEDNNPQLTALGYRQHDKPSITAFQRHWRQNKVDGIWDQECSQRLADLLAQLSD